MLGILPEEYVGNNKLIDHCDVLKRIESILGLRLIYIFRSNVYKAHKCKFQIDMVFR